MKPNIVVFTMLSLLIFPPLAIAEDEYRVRNPYLDNYLESHSLTVKPRDPQILAAEKHQCVEAAQAIAAYAKEHGVGQAANEITKAADGVFAQYHKRGPQFRMMIFQYFDEEPAGDEGDFLILQGHSVYKNLVGMKFLLHDFADLSGWKYMLEDRKAGASPQGKGWVAGLIWIDEFWPGNGNMQLADCYDQRITDLDEEGEFNATVCTATAEAHQ